MCMLPLTCTGVAGDIGMGGLCFVIIYFYLLFHTQSTFVSTLGMLHVFLSFFVAYAVHKSCVSEWFPFLLFIGLFVVRASQPAPCCARTIVTSLVSLSCRFAEWERTIFLYL